MSNIVKRLSEYVANQIAAGEVVSGPSSVVKELMENAVDAGSEVVIVSVKGDGCELIQVVDDGKGMSFDDALTAFDRHATSKITDINDIYSLQTFGFRGEALASIAAVAEVAYVPGRGGAGNIGCYKRRKIDKSCSGGLFQRFAVRGAQPVL